MTNVFKFPTQKAAQKPAKKSRKAKAANFYSYHRIELAMKIASILAKDVEAVDLLHGVIRSWTVKGVACGVIDPEVQARCAQYLDDKYQTSCMGELVSAEFGIPL